jgi:DNA-binding CsgD family transcriptional regulator
VTSAQLDVLPEDVLAEDDVLPEDREDQSLVGLMYRLVPCEWITLATVDPGTGQCRSRSWSGAIPSPPETVPACRTAIPSSSISLLPEKGIEHPSLPWLRHHPRTLDPWRLTAAESTRGVEGMSGAHGQQNLHGYSLLVLPLSAEPPWLAAWLLTRSADDFSLLELDVARLIAPGLRQRWSLGRRRMDSVTGRELEVLRLIAAGLTATAVARRCQISARTVHKHLENAYAKLGCHDRLLGRRAGLR